MLKRALLFFQLVISFCLLGLTNPLEADWLPVVDISENGTFPTNTNYGNPDIAVDSSGNAIAVWFDSALGLVRSAYKPFNTTAWEAPETVSNMFSGGNEVIPRVTVDGSGNAIAIWSTGTISSSGVIQANTRPFGGSWSSVATVSSLANVSQGQISTIASGYTIAVWTNASTQEIQASILSGGVWSSPVDISGAAANVSYPDVIIDSAGNATAIWGNTTVTQIQSSVLPFGGSWSSPVNVGPGPTTVNTGAPRLGVDGAGTVHAVWFNNSFIRTSSLPLAGTWSSPIPISISAPNIYPTIAVSANGQAVALWGQTGVGLLPANFFDGTSWGTPVSISSNTGGSIIAPQVAVDDEGNFTAVWPTTGFIQSNTKSASNTNTWGSPTNISDGTSDIYPQIAINGSGITEVVWVSTGTGFIQSTGRSVEVTGLNPFHGPASGGTVVQIIGTGFENVTSVTFGGTSVAFVVNTANMITVTAPAGIAGDSVQVVVHTATGSSTESPDSLYSYDIPPSVTGLNPSSGSASGGNTVTVSGMGFGSGVLSVTVGGVSVPFTVISPTEISITMPPGTQGDQVQVIVTTTIGTSSPGPSSLYTYTSTINPPTNLTGKVIKDIFVTQKEVGNNLSWTKSTSTNVVAYLIYRNGRLIARVPQSALPTYMDSNQTNKAERYTIYAVDAQGNRSVGVTIVVS